MKEKQTSESDQTKWSKRSIFYITFSVFYLFRYCSVLCPGLALDDSVDVLSRSTVKQVMSL